MRSRILVGLVAGMVGGALGWLLQESFIDYNAMARQRSVAMGAHEFQIIALCVGGMIGLFLGAVDGIVEANARKLLRGALMGAFCGVLLGSIGLMLGSMVYNALGGSDASHANTSLGGFAVQVIARSLGWACMGLGLGVGSAIVTRSPQRIRNGAIGGFLGGLVGGFVFDLVALGAASPIESTVGAPVVRDVGGMSRAIGFTAIGGLSGLFIGLVEELLKQAWVKVLAGRNEGKDFILTKPLSILGRDERCDVPLFGDTNIGVQHAAIRAEGNRHVLMDAKTPLGTVVNGQRVPPGGELLLRDGDMIQIGAQRILFREKATASKMARPVVDAPSAKSRTAASAVAMPSHLCPFCGSPRDAAGTCLCTVSGSPVAPQQPDPRFGGTVPGMGNNLAANLGSSAGLVGYGPGASGSVYRGTGTPALGSTGAAELGGVYMARLVGIEGPYNGEVFFLTGQTSTIGRGTDRDIVLAADQTVSRNHAHIANEGGDLAIYDDGSSNGTFVNGLRITMQVLVSGDILQIGQNSKFRFE